MTTQKPTTLPWHQASLRALVEGFYDAQELRIRLNNRIRQVNDAAMEAWGIPASLRKELKDRDHVLGPGTSTRIRFAVSQAMVNVTPGLALIIPGTVATIEGAPPATNEPITIRVTEDMTKELPGLTAETKDTRRGLAEFLTQDQLESVDALLREHNKPLKDVDKAEQDFHQLISDKIAGHPLWKRWESVRGIGPIAIAGCLAWLDPAVAQHPSSFWRFMGLHVVCSACGGPMGQCNCGAPGAAARRQRGQKMTWNPTAKVHAWKVARSLLMADSPDYRPLYDRFKADEQARNLSRRVTIAECDGMVLAEPVEGLKPGLLIKKRAEGGGETDDWRTLQNSDLADVSVTMSAGQIHNRALRKMVKIWLAHIWITWREELGLPTSGPYAHPDMGPGFIPPPV